jgi:hypothetical protein
LQNTPPKFKQLFGIFFSVFTILLVAVFIVIIVARNLGIITAIVLIVIPVAIRYIVYKLTRI